MKRINLITGCLFIASGIASAAPISGQGTWESTLQGRDLDGNLSTFEAYYDTVLDITWLADANLGETHMNWVDANAWAANLNIGGSTGWRPPNTHPVDGTTENDINVSAIGSEDRAYNVSAPGTLYEGSTASEMAHLFYNTLGNLGYCDPVLSTTSTCSPYPETVVTDSDNFNSGPFINIMFAYWSAQEYAPLGYSAWSFDMDSGFQGGFTKSNTYHAWAVHDGDVADVTAVPLPAGIWLLASGLFGMIGITRRRRSKSA